MGYRLTQLEPVELVKMVPRELEAQLEGVPLCSTVPQSWADAGLATEAAVRKKSRCLPCPG